MVDFVVEFYKNSIHYDDLDSTAGTSCFVLSGKEFLQKCTHSEHLTLKTIRLAESEKSEETPRNHRYALVESFFVMEKFNKA